MKNCDQKVGLSRVGFNILYFVFLYFYSWEPVSVLPPLYCLLPQGLALMALWQIWPYSLLNYHKPCWFGGREYSATGHDTWTVTNCIQLLFSRQLNLLHGMVPTVQQLEFQSTQPTCKHFYTALEWPSQAQAGVNIAMFTFSRSASILYLHTQH